MNLTVRSFTFHELGRLEEPEEDQGDEEADDLPLVLTHLPQLPLLGSDHLLNPLLVLLRLVLPAQSEPLYDDDHQPGYHGIDQHQRHTEGHPTSVAHRVFSCSGEISVW